MNRDRGGRGGGPLQISNLGNDQYTSGPQIFHSVGENSAPDPEITKREDENIRRAKEAFHKRHTTDLDLPLRPGYGEKKFRMRTNYFQVTLNTNKELFRYDVKIQPVSNGARAIQNGRKRRQFYKILFQDQPDFQARRGGIATDYADTLITCGRLFDRSLRSKEYAQVYRSESDTQDNTASSSDQRYNVTVQFIDLVSSSELIAYINSQPNDPSDFNSRLSVIQAMNIIVAGSPNKNQTMFQAGQNKFFSYPRNMNGRSFGHVYGDCDLTDGLIAVRGYYSSVRTSTSRILLNLNAQCSAFYPEINLLQLMRIFAGRERIPNGKYQDLEDFIQKLRIRTEQITREGKTVVREKTIRGFSHKYEKIYGRNGKLILNPNGSPKMKGTKGADHDYGSSDSITFLCDTNRPPEEMSISKYFARQYKKLLGSPTELVVNCGTDEEPKWIPPERCTIMPGQPYRGPLSDRQKSNMLTVAARGPSENARRISGDGLRVIGIQPRSQTLNDFGVTVSAKMVSVHARLLPIPSVEYDGGDFFTPQLAEWNLRNKQFISHVPISRWSYLGLGCGNNISKSQWDYFQSALRNCGMGTEQPVPYDGFYAHLPGNGDDEKNDKEIRIAIEKAKNAGLRILWVILAKKSAPIYARVKFWADVKYGIHTVCVVQEKLDNGSMYYANVTHKFNLKLGGVNHKVSNQDLGIIHEQSTMVVGIDVTHPTPKSIEDAPSIVGMVASVDDTFGQWPGSIRTQRSRQEIQKERKEKQQNGRETGPDGEDVMVSHIGDLLDERLKVYYDKNNNTLPRNILIYRDGVSEGQYQAVLALELKSIRNTCKNKYMSKKINPPKITIVIVAKRHHTRFYPTDSDPKYVDDKHYANKTDQDSHRPLCNPRNGTIVDRGITMQDGWDFYLQSHVALKGTAKPTHYVVLHDDIGLGGGKLEQITHNLCYHYGIATKAVSICTPAYYADILCERGRCYLAKHVNTRGKLPGTRYDANESPWTRGVHADLRDSMFYI